MHEAPNHCRLYRILGWFTQVTSQIQIPSVAYGTARSVAGRLFGEDSGKTRIENALCSFFTVVKNIRAYIAAHELDFLGGLDGVGRGVVISRDRYRFREAEAHTIVSSRSDHLPILIKVVERRSHWNLRRYKFENLWLQEATCREIVIKSWESSLGLDLLHRIDHCNAAVWKWGKSFTRKFRERIDYWSRRMEALKRRSDHQGCLLFREAQFHHLKALEHQNAYWRQRAKEFWLKCGDMNTTYFHNAFRRRRQNNHIIGLRNDRGEWCEKDNLLPHEWIILTINDYDHATCGRILTVAWKIWAERNNRIWNGVKSSHANTLTDATVFLSAWQHVHSTICPPPRSCLTVRWEKPPLGWFKVNTDAAVDSSTKVTGFGFIIRDSHGAFVAAARSSWKGILQPKIAEAIAIREALS
nr:uncharacterized protein LOC109184133 isoform X2 [Ipomoea batatas]